MCLVHDEFGGNGADVRRYGEENCVETRLEEMNVVRSNEDMCQPHDVVTLGVESEVHQGGEHDQHLNVSMKCGTDVWGSKDVLEFQSHENDVCNSGATVGVESHDYSGERM